MQTGGVVRRTDSGNNELRREQPTEIRLAGIRRIFCDCCCMLPAHSPYFTVRLVGGCAQAFPKHSSKACGAGVGERGTTRLG